MNRRMRRLYRELRQRPLAGSAAVTAPLAYTQDESLRQAELDNLRAQRLAQRLAPPPSRGALWSPLAAAPPSPVGQVLLQFGPFRGLGVRTLDVEQLELVLRACAYAEAQPTAHHQVERERCAATRVAVEAELQRRRDGKP